MAREFAKFKIYFERVRNFKNFDAKILKNFMNFCEFCEPKFQNFHGAVKRNFKILLRILARALAKTLATDFNTNLTRRLTANLCKSSIMLCLGFLCKVFATNFSKKPYKSFDANIFENARHKFLNEFYGLGHIQSINFTRIASLSRQQLSFIKIEIQQTIFTPPQAYLLR